MIQNKKIIELTNEHRGQGSAMFTGRPQGKQVREVLEIDKKDNSDNQFKIVVPKGTTSFNASFFLGLFYPSIKKLGGYDNFLDKYEFQIEEENPIIKQGLEDDLSDCERQSRNEFSKKTGLSIF